MDSSRTGESPQDHVNRIRNENKVGDRTPLNRNITGFSNALNILSNQLYHKSTHFLLELIQNADDNSYDPSVTEPTLSISYDDKGIRIDCNEVGFSAANVDALCTVGDSTKTGLGHSTRYIGEKGIGFKSVFKVADVIWISSRGYSFKLDKRNKPLGMITPIWAEFPRKARPKWTSFYMQFSETYNKEEVVRDIKSLDPRMLIFLRRLRKIHLKVFQDGRTWETHLRRTDEDEKQGLVISLTRDGESLRYLVRRHIITKLPFEEKRRDCSESEVLLAFPIAGTTKTQHCGPQSVYAFLPIGDCGFKFLIQSDFLLTANREDIDQSSQWNHCLRKGVAEACFNAISQFNSTPSLRYSWPHYAPTDQVSSFFKPVQTYVLKKIAEAPVLESWKGILCKPSSLFYVPSSMLDDQGVPYTLNKQTEHKYLSAKYPSSEIESVLTLGVKQLSEADFLEDLAAMTAFGDSLTKSFRQQSWEWHSQLAKILQEMVARPEHRLRISKLEIIPLKDGRWVSAKDNTIFFSEQTNITDIPDGIPIMVVNHIAEAQSEGKRLYTQLGVKPFQVLEICSLIRDLHASGPLRALTRKQLISHATFLYKSSWQPPDSFELWFASEQDEHLHGSSLYIYPTVGENITAAPLLKMLQPSFPFLHRDYGLAFPEDAKAWSQWLTRHFHLSQMPRLVSSTTGKGFELSRDFKFILKNGELAHVLKLLRDNWDHYGKWIEQGEWDNSSSQQSASKSRVREELASMEITCGRRKVALGKTILPSIDFDLEDIPSIPFLNVEDPKNHRWQVLSNLGVGVKKDVYYYIVCIESLRASEQPSKHVSMLYKKLQAECNGNEEIIGNLFRKSPLIYTQYSKSTQSKVWAKSGDCSEAKSRIEEEYPDTEQLFRCIFANGNQGRKGIVLDAQNISRSSDLESISQIFTKMSEALRGLSKPKASALIKMIQDKRIYPIRRKTEQAGYDDLSDLGGATSWFIADTDHLLDRFSGKVPLLAFTVAQVQDIEDLFNVLKLAPRKLSALVKTETVAKGRIVLHREYSRDLQHKAIHFARLIPNSVQNRSEIVRLVKNVRVSSATIINQEYTLISDSFKADGRPHQGQFAYVSKETHLSLFLTEETIKSPCPPFELGEFLATYCNIKGPRERALLQIALNEKDVKRIQQTFYREGILKREELVDYDAPVDERPTPERVSLPFARGAMPEDESPFTEKNDPEDYSGPGDDDQHARRRALSKNSTAKGSKILDENQAEKHAESLSRSHSELESSEQTARLENTYTGDVVALTRKAEDPSDNVYLGELQMSRLLEQQLGKAYNPNIHWTSVMRSRAGHGSFKASALENAAFTFTGRDTAEIFTDFLAHIGYLNARLWKGFPPTYHIEVAATAGNVLAPFVWSVPQFERARAYRLDYSSSETPKNVLILVRMFNIHQNLRVYFHVDPWKLYMQNLLEIRPDSCFAVTMSPKALNRTSYMNTVNDQHEQYYAHTFGGLSIQPPPPGLDCTKLMPPMPSASPGISTLAYRALLGKDDIRLFSLSPGYKSSPLRGLLFHTSLKLAQNYRALSYVWGNTIHRSGLLTPDGHLSVTSNLYMALQQLRDTRESTVLWIDAICINQKDNEEKAGQIRLMSQIYQSATSVVAYLGPDTPVNDLALQTLMQIKTKEQGPTEWPKHLLPVPTSWADESIPPPNDNSWRCIGQFFGLSWFRRIWIVQEVIAGAKLSIICGNWKLDWNELFTAVTVIVKEMDTSGTAYASHDLQLKPVTTLAQFREWEGKGSRWMLLYLLEKFGYAESTLSRDRLFALLGFAEDGNNPVFQPDYTMPFEAVIRKFAWAFIDQGRVMEMLYHAGLKLDNQTSGRRFPSWIPDWTKPSKVTLEKSTNRGVKCSASGYSHPQVSRHASDKVLGLQGLLFDEVTSIGKFQNTPETMESYLNEGAEMIASLNPVLGGSRSELAWRVPIADATFSDVIVSTKLDMESSYKALRHLFDTDSSTEMKLADYEKFQSDDSGPANSPPPLLKAQNYINALQTNLLGWRFFTTRKGHVGIAPDGLRFDTVAIFSGGKVPFLLRKRPSIESGWSLIGECYVHGIMEGQGYEEKDIKLIYLY